MPDGMPSGLSMSEIGQAAKQTGGQMKKLFDPFVKTAQSQVTGQPVAPQQSQGGVKAPPAARPPSESVPTSGTFDLSSLAQGVKQQVTGAKPTPQGTYPFPGMQKPQMPSSQPPSEFIPTQASADANTLGGDIFNLGESAKKNPFEKTMQQQPNVAQISAEEQQKKEMEDKQQVEILRSRLHDEAVKKTMEAGQTKQNKKEEEKKKNEQEEQEEQEKKEQQKEEMMAPVMAPGKQKRGFGFKKVKTAMSNMLNSMLQRNKGSHEGKGGKG